MQVGKFTLELDERVIGACDVAGAAGFSAHAGRGRDHGAYYLGMLTHAEIIVRAPNDDVACTMRGMPGGAWKATGVALEVGKNSIPALVPQFGQRLREMYLIIHCSHPRKISEKGELSRCCSVVREINDKAASRCVLCFAL